MTKVIEYYGIQPYVIMSDLSEELLLQTVFKAKIPNFEFEDDEQSDEYTKDCAYLLKKSAEIYFHDVVT